MLLVTVLHIRFQGITIFVGILGNFPILELDLFALNADPSMRVSNFQHAPTLLISHRHIKCCTLHMYMYSDYSNFYSKGL